MAVTEQPIQILDISSGSVPTTSNLITGEYGFDRVNKKLYYNDGSAIVLVNDWATMPSRPSAVKRTIKKGSADVSDNKVYTSTDAFYLDGSNLLVYVNGKQQSLATEFTIDTTTQITFNTALDDNDDLMFEVFTFAFELERDSGTIIRAAGLPSDSYMPCDGRTLQIKDYPDAYEALGQKHSMFAHFCWTNDVGFRDWTRGGFATGGGVIVAMGSGTYITYSTDGGYTWSEANVKSSGTYWYGFLYVDGYFVGVKCGNNSASAPTHSLYCYQTPANVSSAWTVGTINSTIGRYSAPNYDGTRIWVVSRDDDKVYYLNKTSLGTGTPLWTQGSTVSGSYDWWATCSGNGVYLVCGDGTSDQLYRTTDVVSGTWTQVKVPSEITNVQKIIYDDEHFILIGTGGEIAEVTCISKDGLSWELLPHWFGRGYGGKNIDQYNDYYIRFTNGSFSYYSHDKMHWKPMGSWTGDLYSGGNDPEYNIYVNVKRDTKNNDMCNRIMEIHDRETEFKIPFLTPGIGEPGYYIKVTG